MGSTREQTRSFQANFVLSAFGDMGDWMKRKLKPLRLKILDFAPVPTGSTFLRRHPSFKDGDESALASMTTPE